MSTIMLWNINKFWRNW